MNTNTLCSYNGTGGVFLNGSYQVQFGNRTVGTVNVQRQGLYYRFFCTCSLSGDVVCRLRVTCENSHLDLGILVPVKDGFGLDTRIPVKRLGIGDPKFSLVPKQAAISELFVPVYPEEPFAYIGKLKEAFLTRRGAQLGICIKEPGR